MNRPSGWIANPQAMAAVSIHKSYDGHPDLGRFVDPDTWLTPRYILAELGDFDLDPCAADANPNWIAPKFYTKDVDGLSTPWTGRVFMNPPFSNTRPWIRKHAEHGQGISLVPAAVESKIWREVVWTRAAAVFLLHGRTRFANPDGSITTGRPLRSVALIAWTPEDTATLQACRLAGIMLENWRQR